ncbi:MAG: carboxypeptidase-like regulatory domain-containing protein [Ferruginibacter sp.]
MPLSRKPVPYFIAIFFAFGIISIPNLAFAQLTVKGRVIYKTDDAPAAAVSVWLLNHKGIETMTNAAGIFSLHLDNSRTNDTVVISSVGYQSIKLPVNIAVKKSEFVLSEIVKNLEGVTVFNSHEVIGSMSESVGYYRSWSYDKTGGEIGRIFKLPYKQFKIDKIRFKAGNTCDTCALRIHIRKVVNGMPGDEILADSISVLVNRLSLDSKVPEFDLTPYDLIFTEKEFFVGIEVLSCGNGKKGSCSFSFAGTEKGEYVFKSRATNEWRTTDDYTIYLKLFLRF